MTATKISIDGSWTASDKFSDGEGTKVSINGASIAGTGVAVDSLSISLSDWGKVTHTGAASLVGYEAGAGQVGGEYVFEEVNTKGGWSSVDLSMITEGAVSIDGSGLKSLKTINTGDFGDTIVSSIAGVSVNSNAGNDTINITGGANASVNAGAGDDYVSIGGTDANVSLGAGNDTVGIHTTGATVDGGAGDDTFLLGTAAATATVTGGAGADIYDITSNASLTVKDYNAAEGDVLIIDSASGALLEWSVEGSKAEFHSDQVTLGGINAESGIYKAKVNDGAATTEFWKASNTAVKVDASALTDNASIDASLAASGAVVSGGFGNDSITLSNTNKNKVVISTASGKDTIYGAHADSVTFQLTDTKVQDMEWKGSTSVFGVGSASITMDKFAGDKILTVQEGNVTKKVAISDNNDSISAATASVAGINFFLGAGNGTINFSGIKAGGQWYNLTDESIIKGFNNVIGAEGGGVYTGTAKAGSFDFSSSKKSVEVWGGGAGTDNITLNGAADSAAKDVVWFGTADGTDSVFNFSEGFGAKDDVLYLYDMADLSTLKFAASNASLSVETSDGNTIFLKDVVSDGGTQIQLKDANGNIANLALGLDSTNGSTINGVGATSAIGMEDAADKMVLSFAGQKEDLGMVNLGDETRYVNIDNIDANGVANKYNVFAGNANANRITLGGTASTTNEVWGGGASNDTIYAGAGKDVIWFGKGDGNDAVVGFGTGDVIKSYDKILAESFFGYKWDGAKLTMEGNDDDALTVDLAAAGKFKMRDKDNFELTAKVGSGVIDYDKDVKLYLGQSGTENELKVKATTEDVTLFLGNLKEGVIGDTFFNGVQNIDASAAVGKTLLVGDSKTNNVLKGGKVSSEMWGGGASSDTMYGSTGTDKFWFGAGDGEDVIQSGLDKKDTIVLHNVASIDDVTMMVGASSAITLKDGSALVMNGGDESVLNAGLTFQVGIGEGAKSYTYNTKENKFVAKA